MQIEPEEIRDALDALLREANSADDAASFEIVDETAIEALLAEIGVRNLEERE